MMRGLAVVLAALAIPVATRAQTHAVKQSETVVRAVAVFEWTGDEAKPTASRVVPVSVFINNQLEDAGIYMARPVPFALFTGNVFEVQKSGLPEGLVQLAYERHLEGNSGAQFDDGWVGYGMFKPNAQGPVFAARKSGPLPQIVASGGPRPKLGNKTDGVNSTAADDSSRPTMRRRPDSDSADTTSASTSASTPTSTSQDSSRPTMRRRTDSDSSDSTTSTGGDSTATKPAATPATTPAASTSDDPDRPKLQRRTGSDDSTTSDTDTPATATPAAKGSASSDDPDRPTMQRRTSDTGGSSTASTTDTTDEADRPTLKKRAPQQQGKSQKRPQDQASVAGAGGSLNDDPDRPTLHRGAPSSGVDMQGIPPLNGLPKDMQQRAAVSDAKDRPEHDFARPWDSESERLDILAKMEEIARARLAKYDVGAPVAAAPVAAVAAVPHPAAAKGRKAAAAPAPPPPPPVALGDELLRGYTLSYGGAATFVYTASSPGAGGAIRYVSVVAQRESMGEPKVALSSVTDSTHLDRTPWMRLVDVVDADASNRASLLFELRSEHARQFALYRVIGAVAEQVFQTGTTE